MPQSGPGIHAQVFMCFRVLLLRMSGHHITSMWPIIVSEMVQVMIHIEHNLSTDSEEFRYVKYKILIKCNLIVTILTFGTYYNQNVLFFWGVSLIFNF